MTEVSTIATAGRAPAPVQGVPAAPLLEIIDVVKHFPAKDGRGVARAVDGVPAGIGVREDSGPILNNYSRFVPHYF